MSLPVQILPRHEEPSLEALIERVDCGDAQVSVALTLAGGEPAVAELAPFDLRWLGVGVGDIVWVRPATVTAVN